VTTPLHAETDASVARTEPTPAEAMRGWGVVAALCVGYVGIYLCRKNLSVAIPLLQDAFHASKEEVGQVASMGTLAYALGKLLSGPVVDRLGGRLGFLLSMLLVAAAGAAGAFAPGLTALMLFYSLNRFVGSAAWGAAVKLVPTWFGTLRTATVLAVLSLSYVMGGVAATLLARQIVAWGGGWRAVMGWPSLVLLALVMLCATMVRAGPLHGRTTAGGAPSIGRQAFWRLLQRPQFLVACGLSFTVTLMRETFNTWTVDFLTTVQTGTKSVSTAALHSIGFDLAGAAAIVLTGFAYDRVAPGSRRWIISGTLLVLAAVLAILPGAAAASPVAGALLVGMVGLLVYGPYSLLSGVLAVESGGASLAATAANIIDGVGYIAAILAGVMLGRLLDLGGYRLGFGVLAVVTAASALLALALRPATIETAPVA
jgi:MFS transporter, OPA family, glycerol-3-phosphate transporter